MDNACIIRSLENPSPPIDRREVRPNQAVSIAARRGTTVRAESGVLWLTQDGHRQDTILVPGARYLSPEDGKIVVTSVGAGGTIAISQVKPGSETGFRGSALRIDPAVVARLKREARSAPARAVGGWIARGFGVLVKALRGLVTPQGDPALKHK